MPSVYADTSFLQFKKVHCRNCYKCVRNCPVKAIRAGIPILASKASPTAEAIALAKEYGLTLVCAARRDRMKLFAGTKPEV